MIDRCLLTTDKDNKLVMHQLLQELGREIVRQESPKEPGERSILWSHKDSFHVIKKNTGTSKIEGLILDMRLLKEDKSATMVLGLNRKGRFEEDLDMPLLSNVGISLKRYISSIISSHRIGTAARNLNQVALEADAFAKMHNLKLLQLNHVHVSGNYEDFPKELRWLCCDGFPLNSIPSDFPLESLVALKMRHSSLKVLWEGTKFLELLKILDLSHSQSLAKTPHFSKLPNLERLILKNCASLVEVHESIGCLERLVLLNLKDCKSLRHLPRSIVMLTCLETLVISGCSNLEKLPTEMGNMESLTVLNADGIAFNQSLSTTAEVKTMQTFIKPWLLKERKSPGLSLASLPRSLVKLSLVDCNLSDHDFPKDLSSLSSLQELDLSRNQICSLPDCIRGLTGLQILELRSCPRLRTLVGLQKLQKLNFSGSKLLEKLTFSSTSHVPNQTCYTKRCESLVEWMGRFKLEPIENVDREIIHSLGLSNFGSMGNTSAKLITRCSEKPTKFPLQGCYEYNIFCTYLPGSKVPPQFNFKNLGSSIYFTVPSHLSSRVRALSVCSVYELLCDKIDDCFPHTIISNTTKGLIWSHGPEVFGIPEAGEDMMWLSYWKFKNQLEVGDELNVSVVGWESIILVKEVGVHLVYKEEQEEKSTQSASEEEHVSQQITPYGNVVLGKVSADPASTKYYRVGGHYENCPYCPHVYPQQWIYARDPER